MNWKDEIESILREIPGFDPWAQAADSWLDHEAALRAINWFPGHLKHVEGSARGEPFILRRWQAAIVGNLFGWKRKDDAGRIVRRFRQCYIKVARGNGKTPLATGIVLHGYYEDGEAGAQCLLAAGQKEQAGILFRNARGMVEQNEELMERVRIYGGDNHRSLVLHDDPLSFCKVIPAEAAGQHGGIPHIIVVDELHVQENRDLLDVFETAMSKKVRPQPLMVMITTADFDRPSICNEVDSHAHKVRDNNGDESKPGYDPSFLPVIYEVPADEDWTDEKNWAMANPNIDISVSRESLRRAVKKAKETPAFENAVKRLHFNMKTKQDVRLIPMDKWPLGDGKIDLDSLRGRRCYVGIDLSSSEDLTAVDLLFPRDDGGVDVLAFCFCPEAKIQRRARQRVPYDVWARQGHLEATPGDQIDYGVIRERLKSLGAIYEIVEIGTDPHGGAKLEQELIADGFTVTRVVQSMHNMSPPTKELVRLVKLGKLNHGGNPILYWAAGNVAPFYQGVIPEGGDIGDYLDKVPVMPSKQKSAEKIDPITAMIIALAVMMKYPSNAGSVYEDRGMIVL